MSALSLLTWSLIRAQFLEWANFGDHCYMPLHWLKLYLTREIEAHLPFCQRLSSAGETVGSIFSLGLSISLVGRALLRVEVKSFVLFLIS